MKEIYKKSILCGILILFCIIISQAQTYSFDKIEITKVEDNSVTTQTFSISGQFIIYNNLFIDDSVNYEIINMHYIAGNTCDFEIIKDGIRNHIFTSTDLVIIHPIKMNNIKQIVFYNSNKYKP